MAWTQQEEAELQELDAIPILERSKVQNMRHTALSVIRESAMKRQALEDEATIRKERATKAKRGPFYKAAIGLMIAGIGSCGIGVAANGGGGLIMLGILLMIASAFVNWLNQKVTGTD
jgi:hypothetical protein